MADCSYYRCIQERRFIKRELQKWCKDMVYIVGEFLAKNSHFFRTENFLLPLLRPLTPSPPKHRKKQFFNHPKAACCFKLCTLSCISLQHIYFSPSRSDAVLCCATAAKNLLPKINAPNIPQTPMPSRLAIVCHVAGNFPTKNSHFSSLFLPHHRSSRRIYLIS